MSKVKPLENWKKKKAVVNLIKTFVCREEWGNESQRIKHFVFSFAAPVNDISLSSIKVLQFCMRGEKKRLLNVS